MKKMKINSLLTTLMLFVAGAFMYACSPDAGEEIGPVTLAQQVADPCAICAEQSFYKTVGNENEVVGNVRICQTESNLILTYTVSGDREKAWFQRSGYRIYSSVPSAINPGSLTGNDGAIAFIESPEGHKTRSVTYTIPLSSLGENGDPGDIIYIATYVVVPGRDGAGGMIWAGASKPDTQNPNSRYFAYTIIECDTPEPPTPNCGFTIGYWFAKPNVVWENTLTIAGQTYSKADGQAIFKTWNKGGMTDAKMAFLQVSAILLSGLAEHDELSSDVNIILGYFAGRPRISVLSVGKKTSTNLDNPLLFPSDSGIRTSATNISNWLNIDKNHCDTNTIVGL
jgi:hypothetical protein